MRLSVDKIGNLFLYNIGSLPEMCIRDRVYFAKSCAPGSSGLISQRLIQDVRANKGIYSFSSGVFRKPSYLSLIHISVKANPYLLKIALKNIIDNACKYSDKEVNVTLYREQQQIILDIEDRGIGIPQEEIEHIFQSFYRGSNTRDYAGQGIGLSLTLKIISAYHAKLDISSEIEKGTKVRVIF